MSRSSLVRWCLVVCAWVVAMSGSSVTAKSEEIDEVAAIRIAIAGYVAAWNRQDVEAIAAHFDADYDWMNPLGMLLRGRDAVVAYEAAAFARDLPPGVKRSLDYDVYSIRLVTDDVAVVDIRYEGTGMGPRPETATRAMAIAVYVKEDGRWLRAAQRNFHPLRGLE